MNRQEESIALKAAGTISGKYRVPANYILRSIAVAGRHEPVFERIFAKLTNSSYVYEFRDWNHIPRYYGKGSDARILKHFSDKESAINNEVANLTPQILLDGISSTEAYELERRLIDKNSDTILNKNSGIESCANDSTRYRLAQLIRGFSGLMEGLPWNTRRKVSDQVALLSFLCTAFHARKFKGIAISERGLALDTGRSKSTASNALKSLCALGFLKCSMPGNFLHAAQYDLSTDVLKAKWPKNGINELPHTGSHSIEGNHVPHEAPSSPPLDAADGDTRSGEGNALKETPTYGIADDIKWVECLLASDAFRHGGLNKGALLIFLYMASFQDAAFSPRELVDRLSFTRSSVYRWIAKLRSVGYIVLVEKGKYRAIMPTEEALDVTAKRLGTAGRGLRYRERFDIERAVYLSRILTGRTGDGFAILAEWIVKEYHRLLAEMRMIAQSMRHEYAMPRLEWHLVLHVPPLASPLLC